MPKYRVVKVKASKRRVPIKYNTGRPSRKY
jgi:hypothetical protein